MRFAINLLDYLIMIRFFFGFLGERRKVSRLFFLIYSIAAVIFITFINQGKNPTANLIALVCYVVVTAWFFDGNRADKTISVLLYLGLGLIAEILVMWFMGYYPDREQGGNYAYVPFLICEVVRYFFFSMLCAVKKEKNKELPKGTATVMSVILFISLAGCLVIDMEMVESRKSLTGAVIILFTFMIIHLLIFMLFEKLQSVMRIGHEKEMVLQEAQLKESYYKEVEDNNMMLNQLRHDLKNRLMPLCELTEPDLENARNTAREICNEMNQTDGHIYCRNSAVNAICRVKMREAKSKGILMETTIRLPDQIDISYGDLGILYGNLLDNAIEACDRMKTDGKKIVFMTELNGKSLNVTVENSKDSKEYLTEARTLKKDSRNHGFGLKSVKSIVDKYEGIMETEDLGTQFKVRIIMYNIGKTV